MRLRLSVLWIVLFALTACSVPEPLSTPTPIPIQTAAPTPLSEGGSISNPVVTYATFAEMQNALSFPLVEPALLKGMTATYEIVGGRVAQISYTAPSGVPVIYRMAGERIHDLHGDVNERPNNYIMETDPKAAIGARGERAYNAAWMLGGDSFSFFIPSGCPLAEMEAFIQSVPPSR